MTPALAVNSSRRKPALDAIAAFLGDGALENGEGGKSNNQEFNLNEKRPALDSALTLAMDEGSVRTKDRDGRLRVALSNISKACVNPYKGSEIPGWQALGLDPNRVYKLFRDPEELKKAAPTFNGVQILRQHKPVSAADSQPWEVVGSTGTDAKFEDGYLSNSLNFWTQDSIDDIESGRKRELSSGYHYVPDMTPGEFDGEHFDGVMRNIVGNHVALVLDGRAGPDVVVGDSNEEINAMADNRETAKLLNALANRQTSIGALCAYLAPRFKPAVMAMDSKPPMIMAKVFAGVTGANFKASKPEIAKRLRTLAGPLLAQDASLEDVEKVLDMLDGHEIEGGDASVSEPQHNAMEAAAHGQSTLDIPKKVGAEFAKKDEGKTFDEGAFREHLKNAGMDEAGIATTMGMLPKPATGGADESPEEKKKREEDEAKKKAAADEALEKEKKDNAAKDAAMKDMVTKPAMDAAIQTAVSLERTNQNAKHAALKKVLPIVGELAMAFDSAEGVFRHVLKMKGVAGHDTLPAGALETIVDMLPKPGSEHRASEPARLAMDSGAASDFASRFPDAGRIGQG